MGAERISPCTGSYGQPFSKRPSNRLLAQGPVEVHVVTPLQGSEQTVQLFTQKDTSHVPKAIFHLDI